MLNLLSNPNTIINLVYIDLTVKEPFLFRPSGGGSRIGPRGLNNTRRLRVGF
jgi:hypothetical protein